MTAENDRLKLQHREDHLRNRQSTYHEFLDEASTFERMRETVEAVFGDDQHDEDREAARSESSRRFKHLLNGVRLFGTERVRRAADSLQQLHDAIEREWWGLAADAREAGRPEPPGFAFPQHRLHDWNATLGELIDAMRADVAP